MPEGQSQGQQGGAGNGNPGGVSLGTQDAGGQGQQGAGSQTGSGQGAGGQGKTWFDGLATDGDNLKTIQTKQWNGLDAVVKSYRELETAFSARGTASQAPSNPSEYSFNVPKELQGNYNEPFADAFRSVA